MSKDSERGPSATTIFVLGAGGFVAADWALRDKLKIVKFLGGLIKNDSNDPPANPPEGGGTVIPFPGRVKIEDSSSEFAIVALALVAVSLLAWFIAQQRSRVAA